jgi:hypothetical protein
MTGSSLVGLFDRQIGWFLAFENAPSVDTSLVAHIAPSKVQPHVAAFSPPQVRKRLRERREAKLPQRIVFLPPSDHSITSSARSKIDCGTVRPSALAVLRFTAISYFVGS